MTTGETRSRGRARAETPGFDDALVDLSSVHATWIQVAVVVALSPDQLKQVEALIDASEQAPSWPYVFGTKYRRRRRAHVLSAWLEPVNDEYAITLGVAVSGDLYPDAADISGLLGIVADSSRELDFSIEATFQYSESLGNSLVDLPIQFQTVGSHRVEVRGMRLAELDEEENLLSTTIVDRPTNESFFHTVVFSQRALLIPGVISTALMYAQQISRRSFSLRASGGRRK